MTVRSLRPSSENNLRQVFVKLREVPVDTLDGVKIMDLSTDASTWMIRYQAESPGM